MPTSKRENASLILSFPPKTITKLNTGTNAKNAPIQNDFPNGSF